MASVFKRGKSNFWYTRVRVWDGDGWKWVKKSTRESEESVAKEKADLLQRIADRSGPNASSRFREEVFRMVEDFLAPAGGLSRPWNEYAEDWIDIRKERVKAGSERRYRSHIKNFSDWLGKERLDIPMAAVDLPLAQRYYEDLMESGRAPRTCSEIIKTINMIFDRALAEGFIAKNPWKGVEKRTGKHREREPFTVEDIKILLNTCDNGRRTKAHARDWKTMILLGLCTGARAGDCRSMTWEQIERGETWVLSFTPSKKSQSGRVVSLPIVEPLRSHLEGLRWKKGALCPSLVNTPVSDRGGISAQFRTLVDQSGIPVKVIEGSGNGQDFRSKTFHSLRHTLGSFLLNQGVPEEWRMRILDHDSREVHKGYTHADVMAMEEYLKISLEE